MRTATGAEGPTGQNSLGARGPFESRGCRERPGSPKILWSHPGHAAKRERIYGRPKSRVALAGCGRLGGSAAEKELGSLLDTPKQARERRKADDKDVDRTLSLVLFIFTSRA